MVKQALFIAGCLAGLSLQACNNSAADPAKVEAEVQKAQAEGEKKIVEAQAKLEQVAAENKKDVVVARADARIDAANDSATKSGDAAKKPEAIEPAAPPADENVARARITAMEKVADAQFGVDKAKAEATYGVTWPAARVSRAKACRRSAAMARKRRCLPRWQVRRRAATPHGGARRCRRAAARTADRPARA
jgi:hypothetical protein